MDQDELREFIECCKSDLKMVKCIETKMVLKNIIEDLQEYVKEEQ